MVYLLSILPIVAAVALHYWFTYDFEYPVCPPSSSAVVVTGCSSGIGLQTAISLASNGYTVYASVRKQEEFDLFSEFPRIQPILLDITNTTMIEEAVDFISADIEARKLNHHRNSRNNDKTSSSPSSPPPLELVGLINNAAIAYLAAVEEIDMHLFHQVNQVNVYGTIQMIQAFLPLLSRSTCGARIVNVGSVAGVLASPLYGAYSASKFALEAITDSLRLEMEFRHGRGKVSVSIVEPGSVLDTKMRKKNIKVLPQYAANAATGKLGGDAEVGGDAAPYTAAPVPPANTAARAAGPYETWYRYTRDRFKELESKRIGSPVEEVVSNIHHALANPYPRPRYLVGVVGHFPTWLLSALNKGVQVLPTRAVDRILLAMAPKE